MLEQKFVFSLVVFFSCGNFTLIPAFFSIFWIGFFLIGFPNPFIVDSLPSFLFEPNFHFPSGFLFTCRILTLILLFFSFLIFRNDFTNSLIVRSSSRFLFSQ